MGILSNSHCGEVVDVGVVRLSRDKFWWLFDICVERKKLLEHGFDFLELLLYTMHPSGLCGRYGWDTLWPVICRTILAGFTTESWNGATYQQN